jgi:hypothetical protein
MPYARITRTEATPPNTAPQTKATMATMAIGIAPYARITRTEVPPNSAPQTKPTTLGFGIQPIAHNGTMWASLLRFSPKSRHNIVPTAAILTANPTTIAANAISAIITLPGTG